MLLSGGANSSKINKGKVGTPFYLAPELWEDKPCTKKSDIWSLGVILYQLCTHKYPYFATSMEELSAKVLKEKYTPIPVTVNKQFAELI
jgi:serine/threonine protein kinase